MEISSNNIPTPKDLAQKEVTRPISLRVKEKTMLEFEKYAQIYGVTASSLINGVLDSYVDIQNKKNAGDDEYYQSSMKASRKVMSQYLEKLAAKVGAASDEDLCYTLAADTEHANIDEVSPFEYFLDVTENNSGLIEMHDALCTEFMANKEDKCSLSVEDDFHVVIMPAKKYPVVGSMILGYVKKFDNLYPKKTIKIDVNTIEKLVHAINKIENSAELAKKIAKILASYEGVLDE